jgi:hypothetical protein
MQDETGDSDMLIEADNSGYVSLNQYEGVVLSVRIRANWELEECTRFEQGKEGIWYIADDLDREYKPLSPMESESDDSGTQLFYQLRPKSQATAHCLHTHRYLVRYWDHDVYTPHIQVVLFALIEHNQDGTIIWKLNTPKCSLWGVQV